MFGLRPVLALYYFAFFGAMGAYFPYMPAWLQARGLSGLELSIITALSPVMSVLAPPLFGLLADALALRGALIRVASIGAVLALAIMACGVFAAPALGFGVLFGCVLAFTFFRTPMSQISDVLALEGAGDYARLRVWGSIGFMLATPLAGRFVPLEPSWLLPAATALGLLPVIAVSFLLPTRSHLPRQPTLPETRKLLAKGSFQVFLLVAALGQAAHAAYDLCISLHLRDLGASGTTIGFAWAIATLGEVLVMLGSAHWLRRVSLAWCLLASLIAGVARWSFLASVADVDWIMLTQPLHGLTFGMRWVCSLLLVRRFASDATLATAQGLFLAALSAGGALGMIAWGALYDASSTSEVFTAAALVGTFATLTALPLLRRQLTFSLEADASTSARAS